MRVTNQLSSRGAPARRWLRRLDDLAKQWLSCVSGTQAPGHGGLCLVALTRRTASSGGSLGTKAGSAGKPPDGRAVQALARTTRMQSTSSASASRQGAFPARVRIHLYVL